ncbi:MAG TPA: hypothetical protein EYH34_18850 [Planctomycetes bacterium]|nr:hypothetical protein [Planctomycetota bacterium]
MARATGLGKEQAVRGTEGGRSPTGVPPTAAGSGASAPDAPAAAEAKPIPDPAVPEKPVRRWFTAEYKLRVLREADRCPQPGQLEALLRREGLYSSHLSTWRQQRDQGTLAGLAPNWPGWVPSVARGKPKANDPLVRGNERLRRENQRLAEKLRQAETVIEVPPKERILRAFGPPCRRPRATRGCHEGRRRTCPPGGHGRGLPQSGRAPGNALPAS